MKVVYNLVELFCKTVYIGTYDDQDVVAHTYNLATLKYWGRDIVLNFLVINEPLCLYLKLIHNLLANIALFDSGNNT